MLHIGIHIINRNRTQYRFNEGRFFIPMFTAKMGYFVRCLSTYHTCLFTHLIHLPTYLPTVLCTTLFTHLPIYPSSYPPTYLFTNFSIPIYLPIYPSIYILIHLSTSLPTTFLCTNLFTHLPTYECYKELACHQAISTC